jgi:flagellar basal body-associated protein FliL
MADDDQKKEPADEETIAAAPRNPVWRRVFTKQTITIFVAVSVLIQGVAFLYYGVTGRGEDDAAARGEVSLGKFKFEAPSSSREGVLLASFELHVALLPDLDAVGRRQLQRRQFKVQQDIEELLRQAAQGDFEDPSLMELKRQLQEKINETLDKRVVSEVIITDLSVGRAEQQMATSEKTDAAPKDIQWKEKEPTS